ncbi:MAG: type I-U CRISPR-associated helicase/endonuclease Cas3 [Gaiellaceae bacterium]
MTTLPEFDAFFRELWDDRRPFPWQTMLAERVADRTWPQAIDLPTATGKTACIEIAVYALATQAERAVADRTAPRRIWFTVDRRIVVDEAYERASRIARKLACAQKGPLRAVAESLREVAGTDRPLAVARLRGGIFRDDGWARVPSQPAVITSTVDQLGSRLLFRAYGASQLAAPIYAGLAANDSLIILDEAHCSVPFLQTLEAVGGYRDGKWATDAIPTPFGFVVLSATPPAEIPADEVFPGKERSTALDDPELARRLRTSKLAQLVKVRELKGEGDDPLVAEAARRAAAYVAAGHRRVGVMLNRVRTAQEVAERFGEDVDVVVLTGRIRPFERDRVVKRWSCYVRATSPEVPCRPMVVVSTQCLEVGADFSFDALVTEAASLDALRQRFGRLARMGADEPAPAAILARARDAAGKDSDPIYGEALSRTWGLLEHRATEGSEGKEKTRFVDFGVEALKETLGDVDDLAPYLAPTADAPVLLPAHLDLLCQTAPTPFAEPDVQLFLHGKGHGAPDVQVVWRADLSTDDADHTWVETVALCRPASGEMLTVPLYRLRTWLATPGSHDRSSDIEGLDGEADGDGVGAGSVRQCLLWRGRDRTRVVRRAAEVGPGDIVVVPAAYGIEGLGQSAPDQALGRDTLDLWEPVWAGALRPLAVRLNRAVLQPWLASPPLAELVSVAEDAAPDRGAIRDAIDVLVEYQSEEGDVAAPPAWWMDLLRKVRNGRMEQHPAGGLVLFAHGVTGGGQADEPDLFADDDDLTSATGREVPLDEHSRLVQRTATKISRLCLPEELAEAVSLAARWHDVGKLDERFQILLRQGDELAALAGEPLAKSALVPTLPARRHAIREASGLPDGFRHELLSWQLLSSQLEVTDDDAAADLALHLVAGHHGHARPFAPISGDPEPPGVSGSQGDLRIELRAHDRRRLVAPHRFDSGLAEGFWRLTRRYGWWGLAYLEAVLRLSAPGRKFGRDRLKGPEGWRRRGRHGEESFRDRAEQGGAGGA